jgi:transcriptional regulator with XRE-family HTH domain
METFGKRLRAEIGRWGSIRKFSERLTDAGLSGRGASRAMVHKYLKDEGTPSLEFIRAAAVLLNVREEYLETGERPRTEAEKHARQATQIDPDEWWREELRPVQEAFGEGAERLLDKGEVGLILFQTIERLSPRTSLPFAGIGAVLAGRRPRRMPPEKAASDAVKRMIGRALGQPLEGLGLRLEELQTDEFADYVGLICQGLRRLGYAHLRSTAHPLAWMRDRDEEAADGKA